MPNDNLSGAAWFTANQARYPNSSLVTDLDESFREGVADFIAAMRAAGARVTIASTLRSADRAHLMHYSWRVARGEIRAADVPARAGIDIQWNHGTVAQSRAGAQAMVSRFGLRHIASLTSLHIAGKAIDMNITWTGTIRIRNRTGTGVDVAFNSDVDRNTTLHNVGRSYGVIKLVKTTGNPDRPHWSINGR